MLAALSACLSVVSVIALGLGVRFCHVLASLGFPIVLGAFTVI